MDADSRLERVLGRVLSVGSFASTVMMAAGLLLRLAIAPEGGGRAGGGGLDALLLRAGLLTLMGTPIVRVFVSVIEYAQRRDWVFAALTVIVLLELAASVVAALSV